MQRTTHVRSPIEPLPIPSYLFESRHVDLVGPLPPSQGSSYMLIVYQAAEAIGEGCLC